ncbi:DUF4249 family protein [Litoribacter alkaliphilus]|uniref:DUF4249 family protein n=1 Tax=Litoribacter ruber TaxID=702568 RepID=A0AAP2CJB7_9BACT|nr:DUF4249 family protein [Litoribacter alkaliphilus]MBS9523635.1 DUF4249 family protein [Litoribacter alkaliphilus]
MKYRIICALLAILVFGCIDEVHIPNDQIEPKLVVDAWVSDDCNMSYVKIYHSAVFQSGSRHLRFGHPKVYEVYVENQNHEKTSFVYMGQSSYDRELKFQPRPDWEFQESDRYRLNVIMENGDHIQSEWQAVMPKVNIGRFEEDIVERTIFITPLNGNPFPQKHHYLRLRVDIEVDNPHNGHNYFVKTRGIEEQATIGEGDFCTCTCFQETDNIMGYLNIQHAPNLGSSVAQINFAEMTLFRLTRFYLDLNVYAVTEPAAAYLKRISDQQTSTGSIFDPMPFKITGNLKNLTNPEEEILGNFFTANSSRKEEMIRRVEYHAKYRHLNMRRESPPTVESTCLEYYTDSYTEIPIPFRMR